MMNKKALLVASVFLAATSTSIMANDENGKCYVKTPSNEILKTRFGECWNTGTDDSVSKLEECGYVKPAEPKPTPAPVVTRSITPEPAPAPAPVVRTVPETITLAADAVFDFDSAVLTGAAKAFIDMELSKLDSETSITSNVSVVGHTDSMGPESYNQGLSERRAAAVAQYLESHSKITDSQIDMSGNGELNPISENNTRSGRATNRRVEIMFAR